MRLTSVVNRQHIDRMFKKHWRIQGQRIAIDTGAVNHLIELGIPVYDPKDVIQEKRSQLNVDVVGYAPKSIPLNNTHPNWNMQVCYFHRDENVLLLGIDQAKSISNTIEIQDGLPHTMHKSAQPSPVINERVLKMIKSSLLFDTQQEKLQKVKDPIRPAWNFPRTYGITNSRICQLLTTKLLQICENAIKMEGWNERVVLHNMKFHVPLKKGDDLIQLEHRSDQLLMSKSPLKSITSESTADILLPDLHPVKDTITLIPENIYKMQDIYPLKNKVLKYHPHTIFAYFDKMEVKNIYEEEVTETQILGRTLMKTFTVAASYARNKFGNNVKLLPEPVTLQCVHNDGKLFHFGVLQLNTLDLEDKIKNIWYSIPRLQLFSSCEYHKGKPVVEGYNPDVIKYLLAFYQNV